MRMLYERACDASHRHRPLLKIVRVVCMDRPVPSAPKRTPLTVSMGTTGMPAVQHQLPTVEEVSAGGIVVDTTKESLDVAIIARLNRGGRLEWCLQKGHPEGMENSEEAAVREIAEETGIQGQVLRRLGIIDYWFTGDDRRVHKVVHHFLLGAVGGELTVEGDPDGEAEDVEWVAVADLPPRLAYPNERRLAEAARLVLVGGA